MTFLQKIGLYLMALGSKLLTRNDIQDLSTTVRVFITANGRFYGTSRKISHAMTLPIKSGLNEVCEHELKSGLKRITDEVFHGKLPEAFK